MQVLKPEADIFHELRHSFGAMMTVISFSQNATLELLHARFSPPPYGLAAISLFAIYFRHMRDTLF